jgi:hypothetical protein
MTTANVPYEFKHTVMNKQPTRWRASRAAGRSLALAVAVAAMVALLGAGQALAALAPPDEGVPDRQGRIDQQTAARQAGGQGKAERPSQGSPAGSPRHLIRPEPPVAPPPQLDDEQGAPTPVRVTSAGGRGGLVVIVVAAALLLAGGAATTWRVRHRRPQPGSTA